MQIVVLDRAFPLTLSVDAALAIKARGIFDVMALPDDPNQLNGIMTDVSLLAAALWEMTDQTRWTFDSFASLVNGESHERLWEAFKAELFDFFRNETRALVVGYVELAEERLRAMRTSNLTMVSHEPSALGSGFGSPVENLDSTLDPSLCDSSTTWQTVIAQTSGDTVVL